MCWGYTGEQCDQVVTSGGNNGDDDDDNDISVLDWVLLGLLAGLRYSVSSVVESSIPEPGTTI